MNEEQNSQITPAENESQNSETIVDNTSQTKSEQEQPQEDKETKTEDESYAKQQPLPDTASVLSDVQIFLQQLKQDIPEIFQKKTNEESSQEDSTSKAQQTTDNQLLYKGQIISVQINIDAENKNEVLFIESDEEENKVKKIQINLKDTDQDVTTLISNWEREQAKKEVLAHAHKRAVEMGVNYQDIRVKDQKTLWGSCSSRGNLNFSYRLIKMPFVVMDYLVVHELGHLVHLNHSKEYWDLIAKWCPEYKTHRKWLNDNKDFLFTDTKIKI